MSEESRWGKLLRGLRRSPAPDAGPTVQNDDGYPTQHGLTAEPLAEPSSDVAPGPGTAPTAGSDPNTAPAARESPGSGIGRALDALMSIEGSKCVALVDSSSGMILGHAGGGIDIEVAAAGNTQVLRAKVATLRSLGLADSITDILITLSSEYHIIRPLPENPTLFYYLVLDAARANPAMARFKAADADLALTL